MRKCKTCCAELPPVSGRGFPAKYCSANCKKVADDERIKRAWWALPEEVRVEKGKQSSRYAREARHLRRLDEFLNLEVQTCSAVGCERFLSKQNTTGLCAAHSLEVLIPQYRERVRLEKRALRPKCWHVGCENLLARSNATGLCKIHARRVYEREYNAANKEARRESAKRWQAANQDTHKAQRRANRKRRNARKRGAPGHGYSPKQWADVVDCWAGCAYCRVELNAASATIDHIVPIALGGTHHPENLAPACMMCNSLKCAATLEAWKPDAADFVYRTAREIAEIIAPR